MEIRRAEQKDIPRILDLLSQVLEIHAIIRPDLFISGTRKYTDAELQTMIADDMNPIFVADIAGKVQGYCFCQIHDPVDTHNQRASRSLYIDDLCVDQSVRHHQVGRQLLAFVTAYARQIGCYDMTLNVWAGNDAAQAFYEKMGFSPRKTCMEKLL